MPLHIRHGDHHLSFITTIATFGTPLDITLDELAIESYFPADEHTAGFLRHVEPDRSPGHRRQVETRPGRGEAWTG